jgi:hypothetical protein
MIRPRSGSIAVLEIRRSENRNWRRASVFALGFTLSS